MKTMLWPTLGETTGNCPIYKRAPYKEWENNIKDNVICNCPFIGHIRPSIVLNYTFLKFYFKKRRRNGICNTSFS